MNGLIFYGSEFLGQNGVNGACVVDRLGGLVVGDGMNTKFHRDQTVTVWNVFSQQWERFRTVPDHILATLSERERTRIGRHLGQ